MKLHRIYGALLRYLYGFRHSLDRLSDAFFWPLVDLTMWGLTSRYFVSQNINNVVLLSLLGGVLLWIFPWRSQYEISVNLLEDLWNRNLVNMFTTPLKFSEWITTLMLIGIGKSIVSFGFASAVAYALYRTNIYVVGWSLLPWAGLLMLFGWVFGLLVTGVIVRYGTKIQTLAWTSIAIISPFAAIYYPVSVLPEWAQNVAAWVPASYVFEAMRASIVGNPLPLSNLILPTLLCLVYLTIAIIFMYQSFRHIHNRGLISVD